MSLFTLAFKAPNQAVKEVIGNADAVMELATYLDKFKIKFKISDRLGPIDQKTLGLGNFEYWLQKDQNFSS